MQRPDPDSDPDPHLAVRNLSNGPNHCSSGVTLNRWLTLDQEHAIIVSALTRVISGTIATTVREEYSLVATVTLTLPLVPATCMSCNIEGCLGCELFPLSPPRDTQIEQKDAARAYDKAAIEFRGIRAKLNFPEADYSSTATETESLVEQPADASPGTSPASPSAKGSSESDDIFEEDEEMKHLWQLISSPDNN